MVYITYLPSNYLLVCMFILLLSYDFFVLHVVCLLFYRLRRTSQWKFSFKLIIMVTLKKNVSSCFLYFCLSELHFILSCNLARQLIISFYLSFQIMLRFLFFILIYTGKKKSIKSGILHQDMKKSGILFLCKFWSSFGCTLSHFLYDISFLIHRNSVAIWSIPWCNTPHVLCTRYWTN